MQDWLSMWSQRDVVECTRRCTAWKESRISKVLRCFMQVCPNKRERARARERVELVWH